MKRVTSFYESGKTLLRTCHKGISTQTHAEYAEKSDTIKPEGWNEAKPYSSIPGPKELPFLGNKWRFFPYIGEFYNKGTIYIHNQLYNRFGKIARFGGLPYPDLIMLYAPDDIEHLFRNEGIYPIREATSKSFAYYRDNVRPEVFQGSSGVAQVQGKEWHDARSKLNPIVMHPQTVLQYVGDIDIIVDKLIQKMRYAGDADPQMEMPEDFQMYLYAWTLESITFICLDKQLGCLELNLPKDSKPSKIIEAVLEMFPLFFKIERELTAKNIYKTKTWKRYVEVMDFITFTFLEYVEEAMCKLGQKTEKSPEETTMLQQLLKIDKKLAITTALDFLTAGVDTTGKVAGSCLYYLAKTPKAQDTLREEMCKLLPNKNSPVTKEVLSNASYLKAVVKEATRLAPISTGNLRQTVKDMVMSGYQIPKGTNVMACNFLLSLLEENYVQAKEFIPERWLRTTKGNLSVKSTNPFITLPFGFGPRSCIGKRFANLELETAVGKIVRNFYLEWHHKDATFRGTPFYGITDPLRIRIKEVEQ